MKTITAERVERVVYLRGPKDDHSVAIKRPKGRKMVERVYKPTSASLKRVKRLMDYPFCCCSSSYLASMTATHYTIYGEIQTEYFRYL